MREVYPEGEPLVPETAPVEPPDEDEPAPRAIEPVFVYLILVVVLILGLRGLAVDVRYTAVWTAMAFAATLMVVADQIQISRPQIRDIVVGVLVGLIVALPVLLVGSSALKTVSNSIFINTSDTSIFQMLAFSMPLAETLFFRAAMQSSRSQLMTSISASIWSILLFFPQLDVKNFPFVALVIALFFIFASFLYSYLNHRAGLMASWACQITINLLLLFMPRFVTFM